MDKITVIGGGSWGTTLANLLVENGKDVIIYDIFLDTVNEINTLHTNKSKLGDIALLDRLIATNNLSKALDKRNVIIMAVPTAFIRQSLKEINLLLKQKVIICNVSKGLELKTHKRVSEIVKEEINQEYLEHYIVLSGPSHAEEVIQKKITMVVSASDDSKYAKKIQRLFSNDYFRVYTSDDVIGVELSGSLKNIFAIASGMIDGLGYGINTKASLITRGLIEMKRITKLLGGKEETLNGLVGVGDLIVTCTTELSRNYSFGILVGKGLKREEAEKQVKMVVEGVKTCKSTYNLSKELKISTPIIDSVYRILFMDKDPNKEVSLLMNRELKKEYI